MGERKESKMGEIHAGKLRFVNGQMGRKGAVQSCVLLVVRLLVFDQAYPLLGSRRCISMHIGTE